MDVQTPAPTGTGATPQDQDLDPIKLRAFQQQLEEQQNLSLAVAGGAVAAVIGAAVWAAITVATKFQIGWMAVGVGFLVGFAVQRLGKGVAKTFGLVGAVFALLGCLLGNLMSACGFLATEKSVSFLHVLVATLQNPGLAVDLLKAAFTPMDLLFYGIAVYEGYRFSFRRVTPAELARLAKTPR